MKAKTYPLRLKVLGAAHVWLKVGKLVADYFIDLVVAGFITVYWYIGCNHHHNQGRLQDHKYPDFLYLL